MANVDFDRNAQPKAPHTGVQSVWQRVSLSATSSVGDVFRVIKLPHGAIVDDVVVYAGGAFAEVSVVAIGIESDVDKFRGSASLSLLPVRCVIGLGDDNRISVSDGAVNRYEYLVIRPSTAISVGHYLTFNVKYHMDEAADS